MAVYGEKELKKMLRESKGEPISGGVVKVNGKKVEREGKVSEKMLEKTKRFLEIGAEEAEVDARQAMQAFAHNANSLKSRAANQVPFSSINLGLDTSEAGRLITRSFLEVTMRGMGNGETFIYPISIFHVLTGINYLPGDPNYDLYNLAIKCSAQRLYPNFNNLDAPFQYKYLRNKKGKLLWKAREDFYIARGLITREELDSIPDKDPYFKSNLMERIRIVSEIDLEQRRKRNPVFSVAKFFQGTEDEKMVERAHKQGCQFPAQCDYLKSGADDRCTPGRMGCRTWTQQDVLVPCSTTEEPKNYSFIRNERPPYEVAAGRGNFSFVTLNLPRYAIEAAKTTDKAFLSRKNAKPIQEAKLSAFFKQILFYGNQAKEVLQLKERIIGDKLGKNFAFSIGEKMILGSDEIGENDKTAPIWEHFSKAIGYIGLHEAMLALYGDDHVDLPEEGLDVIVFMRKMTDAMSMGYQVQVRDGVEGEWWKEIWDVNADGWSERFILTDMSGNEIDVEGIPNLPHANYGSFATPAEGSCMTFLKADKKEYGVIKGITDKDYYTNSNHVWVKREITVGEKVATEAPYHALTQGGNIFYVETDGLVKDNPKAFAEMLEKMHDAELGYCAANHPVDYCPVCRVSGVFPEDEGCPKCGAGEDEIVRLRRVTGYLSTGGASRWNSGKKAELKDRVKHQ